MSLFGMIFNGAVSFAVSKTLNTIIECSKCDEQIPTSIKNKSSNELGCKNCGYSLHQFTNACDSTVNGDGRIGHVLPHIGKCSTESKIRKGLIFEKVVGERIILPIGFEFRDCKVKQFTIEATIFDHDANKPLVSSGKQIIKFSKDKNTWKDIRKFEINWDKMPQSVRDDRVFAVEITMKCAHSEVVVDRERDLQKFYKNGELFIPSMRLDV